MWYKVRDIENKQQQNYGLITYPKISSCSLIFFFNFLWKMSEKCRFITNCSVQIASVIRVSIFILRTFCCCYYHNFVFNFFGFSFRIFPHKKKKVKSPANYETNEINVCDIPSVSRFGKLCKFFFMLEMWPRIKRNGSYSHFGNKHGEN